MLDSTASELPAEVAQLAGFSHVLVTMSLTAVAVLRPRYDEGQQAICDFDWVYLNPAGQRMLHQPATPAASLLTLFPTAKADGVFAVCCQAFETGELRRNQTYYQADGLDGYFLLVAQRAADLLLVNFSDTNEQSRSAAEQALRASQAREQAARAETELQRQQLHHVLEQAPAMICIFDGPRHVFQFVNPPYQALVGERQLLGRPIAEAMPELVGQPIFALLDQVYQTGEAFNAQEMLVQLDHYNEGRQELEQRYYNFIYQARYDLAGTIDGILVFAYEVTPQVLARQQVQQLNQELEARVTERTQQLQEQHIRNARLIHEAPAAIAALSGPDLVFEVLNPAYQALFADRVLLGRPALEALPELLDGPGAALLRQVYETGVTYEGREVLMYFARPGDGLLEARYFDFIYQARYDAAGSIDGLMVFGFEVTERMQRRQQVQRLNEKLAAINQELSASNKELHVTNAQLTRTNADLDTFVYAASHDLKAPISNIEGLLDALQEYLPTQEPMVPRLVSMMENAITRFQQTVGHLTDISRLQMVEALSAEPVEVAAVLEDVRLDLLPLLTSTQAKLVTELEACADLHFSRKSWRSVLINLLSNAVKYRAPGRVPYVQVRGRCLPQHFVLEVQDNGLGLSKVQQAKLFTMFKRLHDHVEGSGVGLYLIKRTIENVGGTLTVTSELGEGSTFTVTLPRN